jgi:hypothetical protein
VPGRPGTLGNVGPSLSPVAGAVSWLEMTVWILIYDLGEELKVFATEDAARAWIEENDPEGVAFEYPVIGTFDG